MAKKLGATHTYAVTSPAEAKSASKEHHGDVDGFDVVIEAVGYPETFEMCQELVGIGGNIANVGVHGAKCDLHIDKLWPRSVSKLSSSLPAGFSVAMWRTDADAW